MAATNVFVGVYLGTDTVYTPKSDKFYDKGESLSFVANLLSGSANERQIDATLKLDTSQVKLIDGPTTLGTEVGHRIALATLLHLKAISQG